MASYGKATALMGEVSDYTSSGFMRDLARAGRERPFEPEDVVFGGWLAHVPP